MPAGAGGYFRGERYFRIADNWEVLSTSALIMIYGPRSLMIHTVS